jgi:diguanylate cyclase (GGDEF)-like protein
LDAHSFLRRQILQAGLDPEQRELQRLQALVSDRYEHLEREVKRVSRANRLMADELGEMLAANETARLELSRRLGELEQVNLALKAQQARTHHFAFHDGLTGLANRTLFAERLTEALASPTASALPVVVHCIDLDQFKAVNDTFGHHVGDELIRVVAARLTGICSPLDTIARLGGDEFAILQPATTLGQACAFADRVVRTIKQTMQLSVGQIGIAGSVGIAIATEPCLSPEELLRRADLALYRAKERGRDQYAVFEAQMDAALQKRHELQQDLRLALSSRQIGLAFQPQFDAEGALLGVEALARWKHPRKGNVPPSQFIEVAEECGLIFELGETVIEQAFEMGNRWPRLKIAVNVSPRQLLMQDFTEVILRTLEKTGARPDQFDLEITESTLMGDTQAALDQLQKLRAMGFGLALDDFGTGYSSLSYLQRYPFTKVKIDKSFTARLDQDDSSAAVVEAVVGIASALKLSVIAEGVETESQLSALRDAGCREIQGFLFGAPCSADDIDRRIGAGSAASPALLSAAL